MSTQKKSTYSTRMLFMFDMLTDPDLHLTFKEHTATTYNMIRYELALLRMDRARANLQKRRAIRNADIDVFRMRKRMKDL